MEIQNNQAPAPTAANTTVQPLTPADLGVTQGQAPRQSPPADPSAAPAQAKQRAAKPAPSPQTRKPDTAYDVSVRLFGLLIAIIGTVILWVVGAYFTLAFLETLGFRPWSWGTVLGVHLAWAAPVLISGIEIGLWPGRTANGIARAWFAGVLGFDTGTTAIGIMSRVLAVPRTLGAMLKSIGASILAFDAWTLVVVVAGLVVGTALALIPERWVRSLIKDAARDIYSLRQMYAQMRAEA